MSAYNPIATMRRLEETGFARKQAEALADELADARTDLVTTDQLNAALAKQALYIIGVLGSLIVGTSAVLGVILSR